MSARIVLLSAVLVLAAAMPAGAGEIVSVLEIHGSPTRIDSITLLSEMPATIPTPDFGGEPGEVDTFELGDHPWPALITIHWEFRERVMDPFRINAPVSDSWYEMVPALEEQDWPSIKFVNLGAVAEPGTSPVLARITAEPNPFAGRTRLSVRLARAARVSVELYDAAGRPVRSLATGSLEPGTYHWTWDGTDDAGNRLAGGIYFTRLAADDDVSVRKLILTD